MLLESCNARICVRTFFWMKFGCALKGGVFVHHLVWNFWSEVSWTLGAAHMSSELSNIHACTVILLAYSFILFAAISQHYFSPTSNQLPASQQYFSLTTNQHQPQHSEQKHCLSEAKLVKHACRMTCFSYYSVLGLFVSERKHYPLWCQCFKIFSCLP